jgi:hypothetical protein
MKNAKESVNCCGVAYSIEAWRVAYGYIVNHRVPDADFERQMKKLGVSRSDAYALYRTQLFRPREISFAKAKSAQGEPRVMVGAEEKLLVSSRLRKR